MLRHRVLIADYPRAAPLWQCWRHLQSVRIVAGNVVHMHVQHEGPAPLLSAQQRRIFGQLLALHSCAAARAQVRGCVVLSGRTPGRQATMQPKHCDNEVAQDMAACRCTLCYANHPKLPYR